MQAFLTLDDLNKFLSSKGVPPLTEAAIDAAIKMQMDEGATEDIVKLHLTQDEEPEQTIGVENAYVDPKDQLLSDYMDLTNETIANLLIEKRQLGTALQAETDSHERCHEGFEEALHEMRLQGYAEAIAASFVPGVPFEQISPGIQASIREQAEQGIRQIDLIRSSS